MNIVHSYYVYCKSQHTSDIKPRSYSKNDKPPSMTKPKGHKYLLIFITTSHSISNSSRTHVKS